MTIVRNQITDVEGAGTPGWVVVRLVGPGLREATQTEIITQQSLQTDADGHWELNLSPNSAEAPYYVVAEQAGDFRTVQHVIHVLASDTPVWLGDVTVEIPLPVGRADAVYAGPPGPPGPPGPNGLGSVDTVNGVVPSAGNVALDADDIPDGTGKKTMTAAERTKLGTVASGATANSSDAFLLERANHTGEQAIDTITDLQTALDDKVETADLSASVSALIQAAPIYLRYAGSPTLNRPATARPVHWFVPVSFTLPTTGTTAGGTTASVTGLDVVSRY